MDIWTRVVLCWNKLHAACSPESPPSLEYTVLSLTTHFFLVSALLIGLTEQSVFVTSGGLKLSVVLTSIYLIKRLFKVVIYPSRADCPSPNSVA